VIAFERACRQIQEPGTDDTPVLPDFGNLMQIATAPVSTTRFTASSFRSVTMSL
jgi:hypothetical protein